MERSIGAECASSLFFWDGAGVSPPDDCLINGWLPPASGIDFPGIPVHRSQARDCKSGDLPQRHSGGQDENQTNDGDGLSVKFARSRS